MTLERRRTEDLCRASLIATDCTDTNDRICHIVQSQHVIWAAWRCTKSFAPKVLYLFKYLHISSSFVITL